MKNHRANWSATNLLIINLRQLDLFARRHRIIDFWDFWSKLVPFKIYSLWFIARPLFRVEIAPEKRSEKRSCSDSGSRDHHSSHESCPFLALHLFGPLLLFKWARVERMCRVFCIAYVRKVVLFGVRWKNVWL